MKKFITQILFTFIFVLFALVGFSQAPPPPPPGHGQTGNQSGGDAPIGSGLVILMSLGAAYGSRKLYKMKKDNLEE